ncbi:MAG: glycosyltransferase family 2 protein [Dehalococcoidia bacterium]
MIAADRPKTVRANVHLPPRPASNGHTPLASVVIPTYNRAQFIGRAVGSALGQTLQDIEVIVVDDGSRDATASVVREIDDGRVRYMKLDRRTGGGRARNVGIAAARAEWVAFLDSDDEWLPAKLEAQFDRASMHGRAEDAIVPCGAYRQDANGPRRVHLRRDLPEGEVLDSLLLSDHPADDHGFWLTTSALLVKRRSLLAVDGFDETLPSFQEFDLLLRLARASHRVLPVDEALMIKHDHLMGRIGTDPIAKLRGFLRVTRSWRRFVVGRLGAAAYDRWVSSRTERIRAMHERRLDELASAAARGEALRYVMAMSPHAAWGRRHLLRALAVAVAPGRSASRAGALSE